MEEPGQRPNSSNEDQENNSNKKRTDDTLNQINIAAVKAGKTLGYITKNLGAGFLREGGKLIFRIATSNEDIDIDLLFGPDNIIGSRNSIEDEVEDNVG